MPNMQIFGAAHADPHLWDPKTPMLAFATLLPFNLQCHAISRKFFVSKKLFEGVLYFFVLTRSLFDFPGTVGQMKNCLLLQSTG